MKVRLYSPFFGVAAGGGEVYLARTAEVARACFPGADVAIVSPVPVDRDRYAVLLGIDLAGVGLETTNPNPGRWRRRLARVAPLRPVRDLVLSGQAQRLAADADLFVHMVYGQPATAAGRRRLLLVQFPHRPGAVERAAHALRRRGSSVGPGAFDLVVCQSEYVRRWVGQLWGASAQVVYPPVSVPATPPDWRAKGRRILTVGRFVVGGHRKRHDLLVGVFRRLVDAGLKGWHLDVAGSVQHDDAADVAYLESVRRLAAGYPVAVHADIPAAQLAVLYRSASVYWHAAGHGVDANRHPGAAEHFGMTIVEAMSHGAVPISYRAGGVPEVIEDGLSGLLWDSLGELERLTLGLIEDGARRHSMGLAAWQRSAEFSLARFNSRMSAVLLDLVGPRP